MMSAEEIKPDTDQTWCQDKLLSFLQEKGEFKVKREVSRGLQNTLIPLFHSFLIPKA